MKFEDPTPDDLASTRRAGDVSPPVMETSFNSETTGGLTPPARQEALFWSQRAKTALHPWLTCIVAVWCIGVAVCSLRPLLGWHMLWRLKWVGVSPASEDVLAVLRRVSERLRLRRAVSVLQSTLAQVPVVVGYLRPVVLMPVSLMTSLPAEQLEAILAHELAHVRRHDFVVNLLQTLIETFFFYHPAVWWLSHQIRVEREHCCDDLVVASFGNRVEYGRALLAIEELRGRSTVLALGVADGSLLARIRRIVGLGSESIANERWSGASVSLMLALCALSLTWCFAMRPGSAKPVGQSNPFAVTLPDGLEVELLGAANYWELFPQSVNLSSIIPNPWWRPDGERLEQWPLSGIAFPKPLDEQEQKRFKDWTSVAVRVRGPNLESLNTWIVIEGARESTTSSGTDRSEKSVVSRSIASAGPLPGIKSGVVRIAVGAGALGPWQQIRPDDSNDADGPIPDELPAAYADMSKVTFREINSQTRLVTGPIDVSKMRASAEMELVDVDGHAVKGAAFAFVDGEWGWTYPIPLARVAHYRFRLRAYRHWVTFENVSFQPGHKTDVKSSLGKTPELRRDPLIATLPNGVRVEFVGLAAMEAEPKTWWKPDGSPLSDVPKYGSETVSVKGQDVRRAIIRVHGDELSYLDVTAPGMTSAFVAESPRSGGPFIRIGGGYAFPPGQKTGRFEVGLATLEPSLSRYMNAKGQRVAFIRRANAGRRSGTLVVDGVDPGQLLDSDSPPGLSLPTRRQSGALLVDAAGGSAPATVEIGELKTLADHIAEDIEVLSVDLPPLRQPALFNGQPVLSAEKEADNKVLRQQTQITWRAPQVSKPMNLELVLIDVHGKQHQHVVSGGGLDERQNRDGTPHWGSTRRFFRFDVPLARVAGFEYRVRPYQHWVTFDNVALNLGEMTDVKVQVETLAVAESAKTESAISESGPESNGLRCHLVAVPATANDESPDLSKSENLFARGDDVTLAVELQNVSDRPQTLIGVRHDAKGQPQFEGKLAPEIFAPYLFELEFTDANGQPVPRASRVFLEMSHRLSGALTHSVEPGKSLVVVLRPSRFYSPMDHQLPPGTYRARVRYHGPSDQDLTYFRSHRSNELRVKAWYGEVTSNTVTFSVANEAIEAKRPKLVWGPEKDGLQAAVEFRPLPGAAPTNDPPGTFPTKPEVSTIFHVKNVSDRTIKFVSETGRQLDEVTATDEAGETKRLEGAFFTGWPILVRWTLKPGEVAELHALTSGISLLDKPGKFTLRYSINFGNLSRNKGEGDDGFPKEDDWHQVLPTGDTPITIRARAENEGVRDKPAQRVSQNFEPIKGEVIDSVTGKPIEGATVRFRFGKLQDGLSTKEKRLAELVFRNVGRFTFELPEAVKGQTNDLFVERIAEHPDYQTSGPGAVPLHLLFNKEPNHAHDFIRKVELVPGKIISGQVFDLNGRPAKGIEIFSGRNRQGWQNGSAHKTTTDANGRYRLVVPDGDRGRIYVIPNHAAAVSRAITPEFGEQPVFQLQRGTRLFGRVIDANGRGLANVVVRADGGERVPQRYAMTDADGKYSLPPCQYGSYTVELLDEGWMHELDKKRARLSDVFVPQKVELPKTAPTERQLDFQPVSSVRVTARYTTSDEQPLSGRALTLQESANSVSWLGKFRETIDQPGLYELQVPRGSEGRIQQDFNGDGFLRIVRDAPDSSPTSPWSMTKFDKDGVSFHIRSLKAASITLRATHDGQPVKIAGSLATPQFADQKAADEAGARLPSHQSRHEGVGKLWFDAHPNIDLLLKLEVPGFKPWQTTLQVAEGENRVIDIPLVSDKAPDKLDAQASGHTDRRN